MKKQLVWMAALIALGAHISRATSLSIGADYFLRGVAITPHDKTHPKLNYYDQRLQAYLVTDLSQDVEAAIRVQSLTPWGMEHKSGETLESAYPNANGAFWIQHAYLRLPNIWERRLILTLGRQPIRWGEGTLLDDNEMGLNALRVQVKLPYWWWPFDMDAFTAKSSETLKEDKDSDLTGLLVGSNRELARWELMVLWETDKNDQSYILAPSTDAVTTRNLKRKTIGLRAKTLLKDAYLKGEYYLQRGSMEKEGGGDVSFSGKGYLFGLGGKNKTKKWGRFGAVLEYAVGSGDDAATPNEDEAFRAPYAQRWDGLERKGYGRYFGATLSDAFSIEHPFVQSSPINSGLPEGASGIQTIKFGVESTPLAKWTFSFDYYQFKAQKGGFSSRGKKLGTEFDYGVEYRYTGLVVFRGSLSDFRTGNAFNPDTKRRAIQKSIEVNLKF